MKKVFSNIWFRCISCLLVIAVVSGTILSILSYVLFVSADERTSRAIQNIYGEEKEYVIILDIDNDDETLNSPITSEFGEINKLYKITNSEDSYDLLFQSTGFDGFKNGTVTIWTRVLFDSGLSPSIEKVMLESFTKQTVMGNLNDSFYNNFLIDITNDYYNGKIFTANKNDTHNNVNAITNATGSATACCNAVNCVLDYIKNMA